MRPRVESDTYAPFSHRPRANLALEIVARGTLLLNVPRLVCKKKRTSVVDYVMRRRRSIWLFTRGGWATHFALTLPVLLAGCGLLWSLAPFWRLANVRKQTKTDQNRPAETPCASPENPCVGGSIPLPGTTDLECPHGLVHEQLLTPASASTQLLDN